MARGHQTQLPYLQQRTVLAGDQHAELLLRCYCKRDQQARRPRAPEVTRMQFDMRGLSSIIVAHAESMGGTLNFYGTAGDSSRRYGHEPQK